MIGSNTYRISHCTLKATNKNWNPILFATFSFLLQLCLTGYVLAENLSVGVDNYSYRNLPLAIMTLVYSAIIAYPGLTDREDAYNFYGRKVSFLLLMDFFVNHYLSLVLIVSGFLVIMMQESFIECVLNTAALLFIPDIDDVLPSLLGFDERSIIENYIMQESLRQFDKLVLKDISREALLSIDESIGIEFGDYYLTNIQESPSQPDCGVIFQPYQIRPSRTGHQIDPSNYVTAHCLIKEITWSYTTSPMYERTTKPRIGYLRIVKLCDVD